MLKQGPIIGVLAPLTGGFYFGGIIAGVADTVHAAGGQIVAIQTHDAGLSHSDHLHPPDFHFPLAWDYITGWVVIVSAVNRAYLQRIHQSGKPVVMVSDTAADLACPTVLPDNRSGVQEAVAHLIQHGHRKIAFAGNLVQKDIQERYAAYQEGLLAAGIQPDPELLFEADDNVEMGGQAAAQRMLSVQLPSTALVAATDFNAIGIMQTLTAAGYTLPRDQAIVGFDDIDAASHVQPALSSIRQQFDMLGRTAGKLLLDQIAGKQVPFKPVYVPTSFVARESCGCDENSSLVLTSVPEVASTPQWKERLRYQIAGCIASPDLPDPLNSAPARSLISDIVDVLDAVIRGHTPRTAAIQPVWRAIFELSPRQESIMGVIRELRQTGRQVVARHYSFNKSAAIRLENFLDTMTLELTRLQMQAQFSDLDYFRSLLRSHYEIAMDLLRSLDENIRTLSWLSWTSARIGCFGMWRSCGENIHGERKLEITGVYNRAGTGLSLIGGSHTLECFPPREMLASETQADEVIFLIPVKAKTSDWGILAIIGPVETKFATGRETFNQWAAFLALALDYETNVRSLREQRENLALAYQRERELVEHARASEERYALAAQAANDGLWDWDLTTQTIYYSSRWKAMLGYAEDMIGTSPDEWLSRVHPDDRSQLLHAIKNHLAGKTTTLECEHRLLGAGNIQLWMLCRGLAVRDATGQAVRMVGSLTDITDRKTLEERLLRDALYDSLTGLPNRKLFHDRLQSAIEYSKRRLDYHFAVLFLDLDGFKVINDSLGHIVGDQLLVAVAGRLKSNLRAVDTAARLGGDEFAILLSDFRNCDDVPTIAQHIHEQLTRPLLLNEHKVVITASIGIAIGRANYERPEDIVRDADIAMYRAKTLGKNTHALFDVSMHEGAVSRLRTESELRRAIEQHEFTLHYQPIVQLATNQIVGLEALIRWQHPVRGLVPPSEFLPVAEETGLIVPIGQSTFLDALRQVRVWNERFPALFPLTVNINVSHKQFWHPSLLEHLLGVLKVAELDPRFLRLEITEGVIMRNPEDANSILQQLHDHGIQLHIDDFGTGYSSLEALHRFPIQALKIDRSFVSRLGRDPRSTEITRTIIMMSHNLGVEVIAEGIETVEQQQQLQELNCKHGQGYLFSKPVEAKAVEQLLEALARQIVER